MKSQTGGGFYFGRGKFWDGNEGRERGDDARADRT
jgi:hypothetical protein